MTDMALPSRAGARQALRHDRRPARRHHRSASRRVRVAAALRRPLLPHRGGEGRLRALGLPSRLRARHPGGAAFAFFTAASGHLNGLVLAAGRRRRDRLGIANAHRGGTAAPSKPRPRSRRCWSRVDARSGCARRQARPHRRARGDRQCHAAAAVRTAAAAAAVPRGSRARAARFRYGPGVFMVHLALSRHLDWKAADDLWRFNYVHLNGKADEIAATYAQGMQGLLPSRPMMVVGQPSHADPSRAPAGQAVIRLQVRAVPAAIAGDAGGSIRERDWATVKEAFADRVVAQLAEHAPGARQAILARHVMSPDDFERENPNLIGGDCVSGSHHLDQNYLGAAVSRLDAVPHADRGVVHGRRVDLARRRRQRRVRLPGRGRPAHGRLLRKCDSAELKAAGASSMENRRAPGIHICLKFLAPASRLGIVRAGIVIAADAEHRTTDLLQPRRQIRHRGIEFGGLDIVLGRMTGHHAHRPRAHHGMLGQESAGTRRPRARM